MLEINGHIHAFSPMAGTVFFSKIKYSVNVVICCNFFSPLNGIVTEAGTDNPMGSILFLQKYNYFVNIIWSFAASFSHLITL